MHVAAQPSASCVQTLGRFLSLRFRAVQYTSHERVWMPACGTAFTRHKGYPTYGVNELSIAVSASAVVEEAGTDENGSKGPEEAYGKVGSVRYPCHSVRTLVQ